MGHILILLLGMLLSIPAWSGTITAVADPYPPFVDATQPKQGISLQIVRAAYATQGYDIEMHFVPWARAINAVKDGEYDILPNAWWTQERTAFLLYSAPYLKSEIKFIKRKGDPFEYRGLESLNGKTVGIVRGYGYGDAFLKATNFTRPEVATVMQNIKKLLLGRIDLTLEDEIVVRSIIKHDAPELQQLIEFTQNPLSIQELHVTSGLKNPRHQAIVDAFNKGLAIIKANGTYDKILIENDLE
ncbi:ABC transporter substrate-binding protein [Vogesella sp. LIG4]|uniref:substrate-binding periplasmic protein n=1 Tax=Vogesella sp. LIG4 TaxID=1192162 RepID=UPI00081FF820|nr:transporter substrate-binding domain-containing protein [Vogesella sp. LIG4]SCK18475.1 amino acid ABC transporter substrate-binding protein, PAAT family [Vogesella sp. LIG4]